MDTIPPLKKAINQLEEQEAKSLLFLWLLQKEQGNAEQLLQMMMDTQESLLKEKHAERAGDP